MILLFRAFHIEAQVSTRLKTMRFSFAISVVWLTTLMATRITFTIARLAETCHMRDVQINGEGIAL
jgi:hypothetical protein